MYNELLLLTLVKWSRGLKNKVKIFNLKMISPMVWEIFLNISKQRLKKEIKFFRKKLDEMQKSQLKLLNFKAKNLLHHKRVWFHKRVKNL